MSQPDADITKISQAMDILARLILEKQKDGTQLKMEYEHKLKELNNLINLILNLGKTSVDDSNPKLKVDCNELDKLLRNRIEIVEKDDKKRYALIPVSEANEEDSMKESITSPKDSKKKKKKKNKILCSYCHESGHTRASCEKKLLNIRP
ncbi:hypothetical protein KAFR_0C02760 [Kazachstania africana CBS 2517]|uniref:CCHC-type domain-containing protein n=1 Tax=Kazachstania africana (strain ATCC 22294 / BCRC 22015 / CBS 2517 / CECT 1963 / NBRC 1671 / NRRL Y-8276) TaxID=1071382 RepID=H2ASB9_KAZAF|nr:hypothetical protein KAFR_0C02760 [Kazachstania africana CBS 2517]CCF57269.1 hypothetical protein KAFR_0C02760 [Kazachstania africana CBS 2517]